MNKNLIILQGIVSSDFISTYKTELVFKQLERFKDRIDQEWDKVIHHFFKLDEEVENLIYAFVSFVEQDIVIGQEFNRYLYRNNPKEIQEIECRICSIINPVVYLPVDKIGRGHKAICVFQFNSITKGGFQLPVIDGFHMNKDGNEVILFNE